MLTPSSNHLRLHVEEPAAPPSCPKIDFPAWKQLTTAFRDLSGWDLRCAAGDLPPRCEVLAVLPEVYGLDAGRLCIERTSKAAPAGERDDATRELGRALGRLLEELQFTRRVVAEREAELAAAIPISVPTSSGSELNHRLQAVLRGLVNGLKGSAAALYLLDDSTTELKLRAHWGLSSLRFLEPARPLRGALGDLEALTGHAVVLEDTSLFPHWNVPEAFESAVCVPVSGPDTLHGTLWFFCHESRDYSAAETELLEIVAGRLAIELERQGLVREATQAKEARETADELTAWTQARVPPIAPILDEWELAATTVREGEASGDFPLWRVTDDDQLRFATASLNGSSASTALGATLLRGALQMSLQQMSCPTESMAQLNQVLWSGTSGSGGASVFYGHLNPVSGCLEYGTAGSADAYILRPHGWEPIVVDGLPLGIDSDWKGPLGLQEIHPGDVLVVISDRHLSSHDHPGDLDSTSLAETLLRHVHLSARELSDLAGQLVAQQCTNPWSRTIMVVKRQDLS